MFPSVLCPMTISGRETAQKLVKSQTSLSGVNLRLACGGGYILGS